MQEDRKWSGWRRKKMKNKIAFKPFYYVFLHISESSPATVCKAGPEDDSISLDLVKMTVYCCCCWAQSEVSFVPPYFPAHLQPINVLPQRTRRSALTLLWIFSARDGDAPRLLFPNVNSLILCTVSHELVGWGEGGGGGGGVGKAEKKGKVGRSDRQGCVRDVAAKERKKALRGEARHRWGGETRRWLCDDGVTKRAEAAWNPSQGESEAVREVCSAAHLKQEVKCWHRLVQSQDFISCC